jgi:hypothetical protein
VKLDLLDHVIRISWMLIMTVWLALASESKEPREIKRDRWSDAAVWIVSIAWGVLLWPRFNGPQLIPRIMFIRMICAALTVIGLVFALWARFYLGSNWSAYISLELDHKLICTGP